MPGMPNIKANLFSTNGWNDMIIVHTRYLIFYIFFGKKISIFSPNQ